MPHIYPVSWCIELGTETKRLLKGRRNAREVRFYREHNLSKNIRAIRARRERAVVEAVEGCAVAFENSAAALHPFAYSTTSALSVIFVLVRRGSDVLGPEGERPLTGTNGRCLK